MTLLIRVPVWSTNKSKNLAPQEVQDTNLEMSRDGRWQTSREEYKTSTSVVQRSFGDLARYVQVWTTYRVLTPKIPIDELRLNPGDAFYMG
jgi:hypothetical protein